MRRSTFVAVVAIALGLYGLYAISFVPALLSGPAAPLLAAAFVIQACAAIIAAVGVWTAASWAPGAVVILGFAAALTECVEGFALGLIPYAHALLVGVLAIVLTLFVAGMIRRPREAVM
jgi:hypothetical protein